MTGALVGLGSRGANSIYMTGALVGLGSRGANSSYTDCQYLCRAASVSAPAAHASVPHSPSIARVGRQVRALSRRCPAWAPHQVHGRCWDPFQCRKAETTLARPGPPPWPNLAALRRNKGAAAVLPGPQKRGFETPPTALRVGPCPCRPILRQAAAKPAQPLGKLLSPAPRAAVT